MIRVCILANAVLGSCLSLVVACGEDEPTSERPEPGGDASPDSGVKDAAREVSTDARAEADATDARDDRECIGEIVYKEPGCDGGAAPVCEPHGDAVCFTEFFCDCEGRTVQGCTYSRVPFSSAGACGDADAGDGSSDADTRG